MNWQEQTQKDAMQFAENMERMFLMAIENASKKLPAQTSNNRGELVMNFIDALITTTVGISGQYINKSGDFEDMVVQAVRDKFTLLRKMELEGNHV
jgi:hypothetical protein